MMKRSNIYCLVKIVYLLPVWVMLLSCESRLADGEVRVSEVLGSNYRKPGADIRLLSNKLVVESSEETVSETLKLQVGHSSGFLSVDLLAPREIILMEGGEGVRLSLEAHTGIVELPLSFYVTSPGRHYLPVSALLELPSGQRLQRAMSLIVQVGDKSERVNKAQLKQNDSSVMRTPEGQLLKILPATEDIHEIRQ